MNDYLTIKSKVGKVILASCFLFIVFFFYFLFFGYKEKIDTYLIYAEFSFAVLYIVCLTSALQSPNRSNKTAFYWVIFLYTLVVAIILRWLFIDYTGELFQEAGDSYTYDEVARASVIQNKALKDHLLSAEQEVITGSLSIDDYGFNVIVYYTYKVCGVEMGRWMMLFLNALCVTFSSLFLAKSFKQLQCDSGVSTICVSVYAFFTFFPVTAAVGLKENFFVLLIVVAFYHVLRYKNRGEFKNLIFALITTTGTFLFRLPVGVMLLMAILACLIINKHNHKKILFFSLLALLVIFVFLSVVFQYIFGVSLEDVLTVSENRIGEGNKAGWFVQLLAALCGPFPNYSRPVQYGIISSFALQLKSIISIYILYSVYVILKKGDYSYYWIVLYYLMGMIMVSVAAVSLDMRYHVTFFPSLILLLGYSFEKVKIYKPFFLIYCFFIVAIVFIYNIR